MEAELTDTSGMNVRPDFGNGKREIFHVYFPSFPNKVEHGRLWGEIHKFKATPDCTHVYITSITSSPDQRKDEEDEKIMEVPKRELGTYNLITDQQPSHKFWIELKSDSDVRCSDVYVDQLLYKSAPVASKHIVLYFYDTSIVESEILEFSPAITSSQCIMKLCCLIRPRETTLCKPEFLPKQARNSPSQCYKQFMLRYHQFQALFNSKSRLRKYNLSSIIFWDMLFGIMVQLFHWYRGTDHTVSLLLTSAQAIADKTHDVINALMGVPYGLKLNKPLSTALGRFFLYHLFMWRKFIDLIKPGVPTLVSAALFIGCLGLSFEMALLSDIICIATVHCQCFYIYAMRLFFFARHGLQATFRMFRGCKFNPLRNRVDFGEFMWDQLHFGMLIFCTLLFLSPTILVFYIVFSVLRIGVRFIQGTLKRLICLMNSIVLSTLILWLLDSPLVAGSVSFEIVSRSTEKRHATIRLAKKKLPFLETWKLAVNQTGSLDLG